VTDSGAAGGLVVGGESGRSDGGIREGGNCGGNRTLAGGLGIAWSIAGMAM